MKKIISVILGIAILDGLSLFFFWAFDILFKNVNFWLSFILLAVFGLGIVWKFSQIAIINIPFIVFKVTSKIPPYIISLYAIITSIGFLNTSQYFPNLTFKICVIVGAVRIISSVYYMLLIPKVVEFNKELKSINNQS